MHLVVFERLDHSDLDSDIQYMKMSNIQHMTRKTYKPYKIGCHVGKGNVYVCVVVKAHAFRPQRILLVR